MRQNQEFSDIYAPNNIKKQNKRLSKTRMYVTLGWLQKQMQKIIELHSQSRGLSLRKVEIISKISNKANPKRLIKGRLINPKYSKGEVVQSLPKVQIGIIPK